MTDSSKLTPWRVTKSDDGGFYYVVSGAEVICNCPVLAVAKQIARDHNAAPHLLKACKAAAPLIYYLLRIRKVAGRQILFREVEEASALMVNALLKADEWLGMTRPLTPQNPAVLAAPPPDGSQDTNYWFSSIDEEEAGKYLGLKKPTMQKWRQTGAGPKYIRISARCVRYRRIDLREWEEARLRKSTSDQGQENES